VSSRFGRLLEETLLVVDGAMGSYLLARATPPRGAVEELCLSNPDAVLAAHLAYIEAGARIIETNTFGANRHKLKAFGLTDEVEAINSAAAKLARKAREVSGKEVLVAGSIGPTSLAIDPADAESEEALRQIYREQARALDARGVDLFLLETFASLPEIRVALEATREVSNLPIVASVTFPGDAWEDLEDSDWPGKVARRLEALGADAIGTNCSLGPRDLLTVLDGMAAASRAPLFAAPNTGVPSYVTGRFVYPESSPEYFAWFAREAARRGARLIGGCCGSTPEHIRAVAAALEGMTPERARVSLASAAAAPPAEDVRTRPKTSALATRVARGEFVVSMQIDPPKGTDLEAGIAAVRAFRDSGLVDAVDINSNPLAHLHLDSLWMAVVCQREGLEAIPHVTPRDASLMGLCGNLLGAWALGIQNVLVITGDPSQHGDRAGSTDVYQTDSIGLVKVVKELNDGRDSSGNPVGNAPNFSIGVAVNPNEPDLDREVDRFRRKVENGADFAMTQVFFEWDCWDRFLARFGGKLPIPALVAVWPLTSHRLALRIHHEVPGILVPDRVLRLLEKAGGRAREEGFAIAREILAEARRRAQGAYVIAPFKSPATALELFES
jgi:methionine synthase I (cobalamin-dependent)/5,10-methylenetetrahydrofolate reductase